ncbi:MAG TPA: 16S rRNA (guanine(527)-N(7))-methyltransferase RsmG [Solirubrobacteraceae bacterium]|nr:16S rRNA (guanine(527)-N(7))-methyltransferase RsmG [Solirubrobacteraceae bacterium]
MHGGGDDWRQALASHDFDDGQLERFGAILRELASAEHAPTTVRDVREAAYAHLADSLVGLDFYEIRSACEVADLGSGAGFPGTALAVALPQTKLSLIESQRRKCEFLRGLCARAGIGNAAVVCARVEDWREGLGANDAVVARALAPQPVVLEYAAPLLRPGGALVDWRGRRNEADEGAAAAAAQELGMRLREIRRVQPFAQARDRHVHVFVKTAQTPARFPRRAGMARKRPLGG